MERLKNHPWFADFNWNKLITRQKKAPYISKSQEIDLESINNDKTLQEYIYQLETNEDTLKRTNTLRESPVNWDQEF